MHKVIENKACLSAWAEETPEISSLLEDRRIRTHLFTVVEVLDEAYGSDRDIEKDLGGFVVIFLGESEEKQKEIQDFLKKYNLNEEDYEFEDIYEDESGGKRVVFRLYLVSGDYAVEMVSMY